MKAARSVAGGADVAALVRSSFDIEVLACDLWFAWWWDEYHVTTELDELRFRVARASDSGYGDLQAQAALACAEAGLDVVVPLRTRAGRHSISIDYPEGSRSALLLPGETRQPGTFDDFGHLGSIAARIHNATDGIARGGAKQWFPEDLAGSDDGWLGRLYADREDDLRYMTEWRSAALATIEAAGDDDIGFLHGELYPAALHQTTAGDLAVGTFEYSGYGPRKYDISIVRWVLELHKRPEAEKLFAEFLADYRKHRPVELTTGELRAWVAVRHLWALRLGWILAAEQGLGGLLDRDALDPRVKFARHWSLS